MKKLITAILACLLAACTVVGCAKIDNEAGNSSTVTENSKVNITISDTENGESTTADPGADTTVEESSEQSVEVSTPESSEESSKEESKPQGGGISTPITTPPTGISADAVDAYFNNSVFVGHSVMVHFKNYVTGWRQSMPNLLGNALFACSSSFSFYNNKHQTPAKADNVLPKYQGTAYNIEQLPAATGAGTVYLGLMGLNDLGMFGKADTCARLAADEVIACIGRIKAANPGVTVVVLSSTYLVGSVSYAKLNNNNMRSLNQYVLDYCNANGIDFVDVARPLTDTKGNLADVYCSDNYCHLKKNAYYVWIDVLRDYATKKQQGTWQNPTGVSAPPMH